LMVAICILPCFIGVIISSAEVFFRDDITLSVAPEHVSAPRTTEVVEQTNTGIS